MTNEIYTDLERLKSLDKKRKDIQYEINQLEKGTVGISYIQFFCEDYPKCFDPEAYKHCGMLRVPKSRTVDEHWNKFFIEPKHLEHIKDLMLADLRTDLEPIEKEIAEIENKNPKPFSKIL